MSFCRVRQPTDEDPLKFARFVRPANGSGFSLRSTETWCVSPLTAIKRSHVPRTMFLSPLGGRLLAINALDDIMGEFFPMPKIYENMKPWGVQQRLNV